MTITALKIALRDLRASWSKFLFVVLAVAAGVGALTGVRGFSQAFGAMLLKEARILTASDVSVRLFSHPTPEQQSVVDSLVKRGVEHTLVTETLSMVTSGAVPDPVLVSMKAVDPQMFPLYGRIALSPGAALRDALRSDTVVVSDDLRLRLNVGAGDMIRAGGQPFRIAGVITAEPDRLSGSFNVGPRLLISREGLERTGLIGPGSRASQRLLFRLAPGSPDIAKVQAELKTAFPEALIVDFRDVNPNISRGLQRATTFLSLVSLIAVVIGAIGVATAMRAHLQTRMDSIAVMKSVGGRSAQILRIYLFQTAILGLTGGLLGVAVGVAVQHIFPALIQRFFQIRPEVSFSVVASAQGLAVGILTTMLFTLPPLLAIREIRPAMIFRRDMPDGGLGWKQRLRASGRGFLTGLALLIGLAAVTGTLVVATWEDAVRIGSIFAGGLAASLLVLTAVGGLLLLAVQAIITRLPRLPVTLRHAMSNLYRPGSQARSVLTALGVGVMFTMTVHLVQSNVLQEIRRNAPPGMANVFFLDITAQQRNEFAALVGKYPGVERQPDILATVSCRIAAVNGVPADQLKLSGGHARHYRMARSISPELRQPQGVSVVQGAWWKDAGQPQVSVTDHAAQVLGVKPGSTITWSAFGRTIESRVAAIHTSDQQRLRGMVEFFITPGALEGLPTVLYAGARVKPEAIASLQRAVYQRFPTITVINVADILDRVQEVVDQIALVIRFISGFAIFAGAVILASSVAGTRFRRVREMAVFKTLGATRARIARMLSVEFLILGTAAGLIGSILANAFTWIVLKRFFEEVPFRVDAPALLISVVATALIAAAAGWLASFPILGQKPLEVLRGE